MMRKTPAAILSVLLTTITVFTPNSMAATPAEINQAINHGMQWLAAQQNIDGSWGTMDQVAKTGFAVLKFETHAVGMEEDPLDPAYEYYDQVTNGLDYIFTEVSMISFEPQPAGNPDTDGDGIGVHWDDFTYYTSIAVMAIAASTHPEVVVDVLDSSVYDWTYEEVVRDAVDYLAFGQNDAYNERGGWGYTANEAGWSDNSNTGYAALGLAYAEAAPPYGFGLMIPPFVKSELNIWIDYIQNDPGPVDDGAEVDPDGGSGYTAPNEMVNILKTGHLLAEMAFVGDTTSDPRVVNATDYIVRHWNDPDDHPGWKGQLDPLTPPFSPASYQAMYTTMTGLEALCIIALDGIDWFDEFSDVLAAQQNPDGSWPSCNFDDGEQILATEWALLTLQKVAPCARIVEPLFAGGSDPGVVYQYAGGTQWNIISRRSLGYAVLCLCEHEGRLYAGTKSTADILDATGQVWRYDGGTKWTLVGDNMDHQTCSLIVFRGDLYAGTAEWGSGRLYRYDGGTAWTMVVDYQWQEGDPLGSWAGFRSLYVWNDLLYIGDILNDLFGHYDGATFTYDADLGGSCIWDYEVYDNNLYASAYYGRVHRSSDGITWTTIRDYQDYDSWELEIFQNYLYVTTGPKLERYDGIGFNLVWTEPRGNETISMTSTGSSLILGTGAEAAFGVPPEIIGVGRVYIYNGTQVQLISGDMGSGIQALLGPRALGVGHDVAVTDVAPSKTVVGQGYSNKVNVTVENQGSFAETFNATAYYSNETLTPEQWGTFWSWGDVNRDGYIDDLDADLISAAWGSSPGSPNWNPDADLDQDGFISVLDVSIYGSNYGSDIWTEFNILGGSVGRHTVIDLSPGGSATLVFSWDTAGIAYGDYIISARVIRVPGEPDITNNAYDDGWVRVTIAGDIDGDYYVGSADAGVLNGAYGTWRGDPLYVPEADIDCDGYIGSADAGVLNGNYGNTAI